MPPILALILCIIFVIFLLRLDRKQYPKSSLALWIPTFWLLLTSIKPLGIWFGSGGANMEEGSVLDRNTLSGILILGLLILMRRHSNLFNIFKKNLWMTLLIGFMLISILWSDTPYVSFKRWTREFIAVVMACLIATEPEPRQALLSICRRSIYVLIPFSYILIHYFPQYGREYGRWSGDLMWIGVATQKNGLALLCLFTILFLAWSFVRRCQVRNEPVAWYLNYAELFVFIMAIWLFMGPNHSLTYSATSTATLAIVTTFLIWLLLKKKKNESISINTVTFIVAIIIIFGTCAPFYGGLMMSDVAAVFKRNETLTGRTDIWSYLVPYVMESPILGYGFGGFWNDEHRAATSSHAHNGYLDIIINIGFFGLILFSIFLLDCCRKAHRTMAIDFYLGCLWICTLMMGIVHNMAESSVTSFTSILSAVNLFMLISFSDNIHDHA